MPKRTPADFVDEATRDDPYELDLGNGKVIRPRSAHHFTHDENVAVRRNQVAWAKWFEEHPLEEPPLDPQDPNYVQRPFDLDLDLRFGKDRAAFWKVWGQAPVSHLRAMFEELDAHYDPTPASEAEKTDAAGEPEGETAGK